MVPLVCQPAMQGKVFWVLVTCLYPFYNFVKRHKLRICALHVLIIMIIIINYKYHKQF